MNILVSACLAGENCKYSGGNKECKKVLKLMDNHTVICVCPEKLGGLPIPRPPAEIKDGRVKTKEGKDVTEEFYEGAKKALEIAKKYNAELAVLKANSPSCGCGKIYDGDFSKSLIDGNGIFAQMLLDENIRVLSENDDLDF